MERLRAKGFRFNDRAVRKHVVVLAEVISRDIGIQKIRYSIMGESSLVLGTCKLWHFFLNELSDVASAMPNFYVLVGNR